MEPIYHSFLTIPILSLLNGIILLFGFYCFGDFLQKKLKLNHVTIKVSEYQYQNIIVSIIFSSIIIYPISLFYGNSNLILKAYSYVLFLVGIFQIFIFFFRLTKNFYLNKNYFSKEKLNFDFILYLIIFFGLGLLSFAPVTNADSLNYHLFTAKYLIDYGEFPNYLTNFHSTYLSGSGEILIALGLAVGSEQFGSILQYSGLISVLGILKKNRAPHIFHLIVFSSPVLIFFVSSIKPQLFTVCTLVLAFSLIFFEEENKRNKFNYLEIRKIFFLITIILSSITVKFSFVLSSLILFIILILKNFKFFKVLQILTIFSILFFIINIPSIFWKYSNLGGNFFELFYSPFSTERYGLSYFKMYLTILSEGNLHWFLFPSGFSNFTNSLGLGTLLIIYLTKIKNSNKYYLVFSIILFTLVTYFFGQFKARFFLEPYMWTAILLSKFHNLINLNKIYHFLLRFQSVIFSCVLIYSVFNLTSGVINSNLRDNVLEKNASGYNFYKWVNSNLTDKKVAIISFDRSIAFSKNFVISKDHLLFANLSNPLAIDYINEIKRLNPQYVVYSKQNSLYKKYEKCMKKLYKSEKNLDHYAVRNPFKKKNKRFDVYIYEINVDLLPECINPEDVDPNARPK